MPIKHKNAQLNYEQSFLITCCQIDPSEEDILFITSYLSNITDHQSLITTATRHGILPLVYQTIKNLHQVSQSTHENLLKDLKSAYMEITKQNMLKSAELIQLNQIATKEGISIIPFKGPVLAQIAYGDISLRQFSDLDILVHREDFRKLTKKMLERGYEPLYPIETFHSDKVMFEMNNDCPFYNKKRGLLVELHWGFFRKLALPTKKFTPWRNTQSITINHYTFQTLSHETHLLYHSLHGSKHVWERFGWIVDIDRFIRTVPHLDWDKIITLAKNMGALKMFLLGPALAQCYFQTPLPDNIKKLCIDVKIQPIINYVHSQLNSDDTSPEDSLIKLSKVIALRDNFYYKFMTLLEFLFRPGINERRTIILPDSLFWLYWILRPFGMIFRFIFCRLLKLCANNKSNS